MILEYYHGDDLNTRIIADYKTQKVTISNFTKDPILCAFGVNEHPTWENYNNFLENRCTPRSRDKVKIWLREIGVDVYDPLLICQKTEGRMYGDTFHIKFIKE